MKKIILGIFFAIMLVISSVCFMACKSNEGIPSGSNQEQTQTGGGEDNSGGDLPVSTKPELTLPEINVPEVEGPVIANPEGTDGIGDESPSQEPSVSSPAHKISDLETINAVYQKYVNEAVSIKTATKVDELVDYIPVDRVGQFILFQKTVEGESGVEPTINSKILNIDTGAIKTVASYVNTTYVAIEELYINNYNYDYGGLSNNFVQLCYKTSQTDESQTPSVDYSSWTIEILDKNCEEIGVGAYGNDLESSIDWYSLAYRFTYSIADYGYANNIPLIYKITNGRSSFYCDSEGVEISLDITDIMNKSEFDNFHIQEIYGESGGYFFYDSSNNRIVSYDKEEKEQFTLDLLSSEEVLAYIVFDSGNYIIQYAVQQEIIAKDYDVLIGDKKYTLITKLVNVADKTATDLECKFVLSDREVKTPCSAAADGEIWTWANGIAAIFKGLGEIGTDKRIDYNYQNTWFGITEDGTIKKTSAIVNGMESIYAQELPNGNLLVAANTGKTYVVKEGVIINELNENLFVYSNFDYTNSYIVISENSTTYILDYDFNIVETLSYDSNTIEQVVGYFNDAILIETTCHTTDGTENTYSLFKDGKRIPFIDNAFVHIIPNLGYEVRTITVENNETTCTYSYYNMDCELIYENIKLPIDVFGIAKNGSVVYACVGEIVEVEGVDTTKYHLEKISK